MNAAQAILDRLAMPEHPGVYWIGRKAIRLTFLSQQQRALNLVWALHNTGSLQSRTEVIVVGAGLAGLTTAFAARKLGATVTLIEKKPVPLHLQRGCQLRFVHPHILDWPAEVSESPITDLPCLNWGAGMAARVSNMILQQWKNVESIDERYGYEVRNIRRSAIDRRPLLIAEGESGNLERSCDLLILAVGFGLERPLPPVPFLSYWENDNLGRPLISEPIPRRYLVTGCGDGGLIDAIRLRINAFDHAEFVYSLSRLGNLGKLKSRLLEIDQSVAREMSDPPIAQRVDAQLGHSAHRADHDANIDKTRQRLIVEIEGELLEREYRQLEIPDGLKDLLTRDLRSDTIVFLNSPSAYPLSLRSSILNRFVVFLLRQYGGLRYRAGEVTVSPTNMGQAYRVSFKHDQFPPEELEVHEVVVRHGPIPAIGRLFPKHVVEACQPRLEDWEDQTRNQLYPPGFLRADRTADRDNVHLDYAILNGPTAAREQFDPLKHDRFGIQVSQGGEVSYVLRPLRGSTSTTEVQPRSFFGIPFRFDPPLEPLEPSATPTAHSRSARLFCGAAIQNIGLPDEAVGAIEHFCTLGCFVRQRETGEVGILTTAFGLGDPQGLQKGQRIVRAGEPHPITTKVIATLAGFVLPVPSGPQSSIAADTVRFNRVEAAVATISPETKIKVGFGKIYRDAPSLFEFTDKMDELIGADVFKVGAASGVTRGRIEDVDETLRLPAWGEQYWYEGLLVITSPDSQSFCVPGDGGSLLVRSDGAVLGLLLAGSSSVAFAMPIARVLEEVKCDLYLEQRKEVPKDRAGHL